MVKRSLVLLLLCATLTSLAASQSTTVNAQVIDADSQTWANGTWTAQLTSPPGVPCCNYVITGGGQVPSQSQSGVLDAAGTASIVVTPNTSISPSGTQWTFNFSPLATPAASFTAAVSVSGTVQALTPTPPGIRVSVSNPVVRVLAYLDAEVTGANIGSSYYNLVDNLTHVCTAVNAAGCTAWQSNGAGTLTNQPNTWTAAQTFSSDIIFNPVGGPNLRLNRAISTSANHPDNGCSFCLGPSDPIVYGCVSCTQGLTFANFLSVNGLVTINLIKGGGSNNPTQVADYLGAKIGWGPAGSQSIGSLQSANSDLVGELAFSGVTTASYTWIVTSYINHPECTFTPQFDVSTNRFWVTYTASTSFTLNFSGAVTGTVGYTCIYRN